MGGYGAIRWALRHPDRFAAAATLSGVVDIVGLTRLEHEPDREKLWHTIFGGRVIEGTDDDPFHLLDTVDPAQAPKLYVGCGTEDRLIRHNERFRDTARARGFDVTDDFRPGEHEWGLWDDTIQDVLRWLPLDRGTAPA
jgi:S-formylglutathione hydrolase FrmB